MAKPPFPHLVGSVHPKHTMCWEARVVQSWGARSPMKLLHSVDVFGLYDDAATVVANLLFLEQIKEGEQDG